ncbi:hypothetical protein DGWBC_0190 [Dehalogenimonas sp. WBC-2]|nr:hypothetical protein DGWBC_0190 [Dehalogenimonas sp. WBC-2]
MDDRLHWVLDKKTPLGRNKLSLLFKMRQIESRKFTRVSLKYNIK